MGAAGEFESKWIRLADLKGNIQAHPEADESFPRQKSQQRAVLQQLMASADPMIAQALADPANIGFIKSVFGLGELVVPGEDAREKQFREISQLLASAPIVVPVTTAGPVRDEGSFGASAASREARDANTASQDDGEPAIESGQPSGEELCRPRKRTSLNFPACRLTSCSTITRRSWRKFVDGLRVTRDK